MILKFIEASTKQPILIMASAISSVAMPQSWEIPSEGTAGVTTTDGRRFHVLGTVEQILAQLIENVGLSHVAIAPIG